LVLLPLSRHSPHPESPIESTGSDFDQANQTELTQGPSARDPISGGPELPLPPHLSPLAGRLQPLQRPGTKNPQPSPSKDPDSGVVLSCQPADYIPLAPKISRASSYHHWPRPPSLLQSVLDEILAKVIPPLSKPVVPGRRKMGKVASYRIPTPNTSMMIGNRISRPGMGCPVKSSPQLPEYDKDQACLRWKDLDRVQKILQRKVRITRFTDPISVRSYSSLLRSSIYFNITMPQTVVFSPRARGRPHLDWQSQHYTSGIPLLRLALHLNVLGTDAVVEILEYLVGHCSVLVTKMVHYHST
jgi:hypothetical protein